MSSSKLPQNGPKEINKQMLMFFAIYWWVSELFPLGTAAEISLAPVTLGTNLTVAAGKAGTWVKLSNVLCPHPGKIFKPIFFARHCIFIPNYCSFCWLLRCHFISPSSVPAWLSFIDICSAVCQSPVDGREGIGDQTPLEVSARVKIGRRLPMVFSFSKRKIMWK